MQTLFFYWPSSSLPSSLILLAVTQSDEMSGDVSTLSTSFLSPPRPRGTKRGWEGDKDKIKTMTDGEKVNSNLRGEENKKKQKERRSGRGFGETRRQGMMNEKVKTESELQRAESGIRGIENMEGQTRQE